MRTPVLAAADRRRSEDGRPICGDGEVLCVAEWAQVEVDRLDTRACVADQVVRPQGGN